jgi:hypothetical protein
MSRAGAPEQLLHAGITGREIVAVSGGPYEPVGFATVAAMVHGIAPEPRRNRFTVLEPAAGSGASCSARRAGRLRQAAGEDRRRQRDVLAHSLFGVDSPPPSGSPSYGWLALVADDVTADVGRPRPGDLDGHVRQGDALPIR